MAVGRSPDDVASLVDAARDGSTRAIARLLTLVENDAAATRTVSALLVSGPAPGSSRVLGLTGPPGVGKSTSTSALVGAFRRSGLRVAVLAIDPSSPFSGGALLGDRIRMGEHAADPGVFIRSMASRGRLGGLSAAVPASLRVLEAAGFDVVLVETVGVGQAEVEIASLADTTLVLLAPGLGDGVQAAKAGILEVADVFVVNKADRDGADALTLDLTHMQSVSWGGSAPSSGSAPGVWRAPIVRTVASSGQGIDDVVAAVSAHAEFLAGSGGLAVRRAARAAAEIEAIVQEAVRARTASLRGNIAVPALAEQVAAGSLDPFVAADTVLAAATQ